MAVLPFDNLSADEETDPFTDGIHDDLLTQLAKIESLKVISRTSVSEYRGTTLSVPEIAEQLGVAAIVEGGVQRAGERIRVNAQLIDAASDEHLWAETFDRRLTAENVFEIQSDLARRIASALRAELTPDEERRLASRPTVDLEAYRLHLRARDLVRQGLSPPVVRAAISLWERAVSRDPEFALAHAQLSIHNTLTYWWHLDDSAERLERGRRAAERALELDPELAEAHVAMARYHYWGQLDYERALRELEIARTLQSGNAEVLQTIAAVRRRQGEFETALELSKQVVDLDPGNAVEHWDLAIAQRFLRDCDAAIRYLDRAIALSPTYPNPYAWKAGNLVLAHGDVEGAHEVIEEWESILGPSGPVHRHRARYLLMQRDYRAALEEFSPLPEEGVVDGHLAYRPHHLRLAEIHRAATGGRNLGPGRIPTAAGAAERA